MKKIIVTGATSYIALSLIQNLLHHNFLVYAVVRPNSKNKGKLPQSKNINVIELDMQDIYKLSEFGLKDIMAIYHFAWDGVRGEKRNSELVQQKNYVMSKECIDVACKMRIPFFIGIGSQAEYGIWNEVITEETVLNPINEYGKSKVQLFNYGMKICETNPITFIWARIFSAFGQGEDSNTLLMQCINKMSCNDAIDLTPCEQMWDYIYVDDIADALLFLLQAEAEKGAYNISYGKARKLKEYIQQLYKILNSKSKLNFGAISYTEGKIVQINPDISKIKKLGWTPQIDFETGIKKIVEGQNK